MAQLESGSYQLRRDAFDLCQLARSVLAVFRQDAVAIGREVRIEAAVENMEVFADEHAVKQMLVKLLSNAAKFSSAGTPISLILDYGPNGNCRLSVEDQGKGMSTEEINVAVQPFQQVDNRLARTAEGTGLGLSITKKLIEVHNGNLEICSAPMKGTRVILHFESLHGDHAGLQSKCLALMQHTGSGNLGAGESDMAYRLSA